MDELAKEYKILFNGITETIESLEGMIGRLRLLQEAAENSYLENCPDAGSAREKPKLIKLHLSG